MKCDWLIQQNLSLAKSSFDCAYRQKDFLVDVGQWQKFNSTEELVEFFDTHDMGEYEDEMPEAHFDVDIKRNHYLIFVDGYVMNKLLQIAKEQVSVESFVDLWLKEKLLEEAKRGAMELH